MTDNGLFAMAAIWQTVETKTGEKIHTVAIITTESNKLMHAIHDRMPVILTKEEEQTWLNNQIKDVKTLEKLIKPFDAEHMYYERVSTLVNNPKNDDIAVIAKI
ncbi:hypothetical protein A2I99_00300 [Acholeplasma laidlawii]|nr:hypothetical protein A2I99_00300 [Acholeplasma laidlawii]